MAMDQTPPHGSERRSATRDDGLERPAASRLAASHRSYAEIMERHAEAVRASRSVYRDPESGHSVFTAVFLARRGYCCASGCRHCPYVEA